MTALFIECEKKQNGVRKQYFVSSDIVYIQIPSVFTQYKENGSVEAHQERHHIDITTFICKRNRLFDVF